MQVRLKFSTLIELISDPLSRVLSVSSYGLEWLGRMRLQQRLTKLTGEDALLSRQQELTDREIKAALAERGL